MDNQSKQNLPRPVFRALKWLRNFYLSHIVRDEVHLMALRWLKDNGDKTLRLDYPLTEESVVFDLGGYKGDFTQEIVNRFDCKVYLFEPVRAFYEICRNRFADNSKVQCFNFGLSSQSGSFFISKEDNASSIVKGGGVAAGEEVRIESFARFVDLNSVSTIDLLKVNIEGGEYDVLPQAINTGYVANIRFLQIQFHNFINGAEQKRAQIRNDLTRTHSEMWNYPFIWESWSRRENV